MNARTAIVALTLLIPGCKDVLEPDDLAGTYQAIDFVFSEGVEETDVLAAGGRLDLVLDASGNVSGTLFVPGPLTEDNMDFTADMAGTYEIQEDRITFTQIADPFVRDVDWVPEGNRLIGGGTFSGVTIVVVLFRT